MGKINELPPYMSILGNKVYASRKWSAVLDDPRIVGLSYFGAQNKILKDLWHDINRNSHVLQIGLTFGNEIITVYGKVHLQGKLDIFDISQTQIDFARERYGHREMEIIKYDATQVWYEKYDIIICYNLLHELPLKTRKIVMDNVLDGLTNGGKAIFVDYAKPKWWNPLRWPLLWYNRLYRPFTESLWEQPIENFCSNKDDFRWNHTYYHGGMYQKTIAVKKILSSEDIVKLTKFFRNIG